MAWLKAGPVIPVRLGHRTGKTDFQWKPEPGIEWRSTTEYLLISLALPRPSDGVAPTRITCPACDAQLTFQVAAARDVTRKRILHFGIAAALVLYFILYLIVIRDVADTWERFGALGTVLQVAVWVAWILSLVGAVIFLTRALSPDFRRSVIAPNMGHWLGNNSPDSIRRSYHEKRSGPTELHGHSVFPPRGKLEDASSL